MLPHQALAEAEVLLGVQAATSILVILAHVGLDVFQLGGLSESE